MLGAPLGGTTRGGQYGLESLAAFFDYAAERQRRRWELFPVKRHGGAGRTRYAGDLLGVRDDGQ